MKQKIRKPYNCAGKIFESFSKIIEEITGI